MKRREAATQAFARDNKLQRVAQALDNVTRIGATCASGSSEQFPQPGIVFKDANGDSELLLPLHEDDTHSIKTRGTISQRDGEFAPAWEIDGSAMEIRSPRWRDFLDDCLTGMRESLGIAPTAAIELSLRTLRLVETGAKLHCATRWDERTKRVGVFGTLLVVLPGAFNGGDIVFAPNHPSARRGDAGESKEETEDSANTAAVQAQSTWRPSARSTPSDLSYAASYNHATYVAEPVADGTALCLVYDLVTPTPRAVPLFAGALAVQRVVDEAFTDYFNVVPPTLAKRSKISTDAWRTINEFAAERHFVYIVFPNTFEELHGDDRRIAQSLASFCAQSGGQFVLYLARVRFCRVELIDKSSGSSDDDYDDGEDMTRVTLHAPWLKYGETVVSNGSPIDVSCREDVAPLGLADRLPDRSAEYLQLPGSYRQVMNQFLGAGRKATAFSTSALVVQPASIELSQNAKLPLRAVIRKLRGLLPESRDDARQYAQRVIFYRSEWDVADWAEFDHFVKIVVEINDLPLFKQLLGVVAVDCIDGHESFAEAVAHFGWNACLDTLVKRIRSTPTLRGQVNWILSVIPSPASSERIDPLLDALLSLFPWTDVKVAPGLRTDSFGYLPEIEQFQDLLQLGLRSSRQKMMGVASVTDAEVMVRVVAPAMMSLVKTHATEPQLLLGLHHVSDILLKMLPAIRNETFAGIRVANHCDKCDELRSFLSSTELDTIVRYSDDMQRRHIKMVIKSALKRPSDLRIENVEAGTALRLIKEPVSDVEGLFGHAEREAKRILDMTRT